MSLVEREPPSSFLPDAGGEPFVAPASFAQARLWLLDRLSPGLAAYNVPLALSIAGPLDPAALAAAFDALAARHETLRTALAAEIADETDEEGQPVQVIYAEGRLPLARIDLAGLAAAAAGEMRAAIAREAVRPFDLGRAPLLRALLFRLAAAEHVLFVNAHHAVVDAWSLGILVRDLLALYGEASGGSPAALPELPIQYADFAAWQREWLQGEALAERSTFWRALLEGAPTSIALPTDRPRRASEDQGTGAFDAGAHALFDLPADAPFHALARGFGATPFMVLLAAFQALLARLSGQRDLLVGTTVANRDRTEVENLIGLFVNTLALRGEMDGDPPFGEHLARVRDMTVGAFGHADLPFEKLVEELKPERRSAENPLFEVAFLFQRPPLAGTGSGDLALSALEVHNARAKFDLSLHVMELGGVFRSFWEYRTALVDPATAERLSRRLATLLADATEHPERRISELALMDAAERRQVAAWSREPEEAPPSAPSVVELFAAQAARTPERIAAVSETRGDEESLTYRELDRRAALLARRLRSLGAGRERPVALLLRRSLDLAIAVLGTLEAGAACVPLDPDYPRERLALMLAESGAAALVAHGSLGDRLPEHELPVVLLDSDPLGEPASEPEDAKAAGPLAPPLPDDLVYILFTSGSTGRPKGVALPHRALANLLAWQLARFGDPEGGTTLQLASLSFDISFQEIFSTWDEGGTLLLVADETRRDPEALLDLLARRQVRRVYLPSIALQQLAGAASGREAPPALRELVTAGEQLQVTPRVRELCAALPGLRLHNQYGPTETHVVTGLVLAGDPAGDPPGHPPSHPDNWPALPSIGHPIPGAAVRLLDAHLAPVPVGVPGEIHLGGVCLARGYHRRPELTAERFVPDPDTGVASERMYRTGDLGRYLPDGAIEYLGRADGQVKVRGVRVEPAEVEAALAAHPEIAECAVVARHPKSGEGGETFLAAYVAPRRAPAPPPRQLRDFLRGKLPDALVPAAFVELAALPRTPSGKVDRRRLPAPEIDRTAPAGFVAPRTPTEELLAGIWSGVLRLERIGAHDNFFDLGGQSLNATTVAAQVRSTFGVELPARSLFETPTLAELAQRIERLRQAADGLELPPIVRAPRTNPPPLSFAQQRLWFLDRLAGGESPFYNIAVPLGLAGRLDPAALGRALSEIVRRHEALRTTFRAGPGGEPVQVIHPPAPFPLPQIDMGALLEPALRAELTRIVREHMRRSFDLARGPLLRLALARLAGDGNHALLLSMHHVISDGWSLEVFVRELAALYQAFAAGRPSPLPEPPVQYADFALWQRRWLAGPMLDKQLAYWRGKLAGAPFALDLPTDRPRPALQTYAGGAERLDLPEATAAALAAVARRERATLFMVLLAAFAALLERQSGQDDMLLGTPIANRNRTEVEGLIGAFVNTLVLRVELAGDPTFDALLAQVRETALGAYAHQDLPFERLVEELQPSRDLSKNPLFQVSFSMGATPWHHFAPPELAIGSLGLDLAQELELFDLTLQIFDTPAGLDVRLAYSSDLFDGATIAGLSRRFETLLAALAADPRRAPAAIPLLSASERRQLAEWGGMASPATPEGATAASLFAAQVARRPEAPALAWSASGELSYEELDRRSNRLARHLEAAGIGPESVVALALDDGIDFATAVLAVWKAGGAYLPLSSDLPPERLAWLLADSGARLVVRRARRGAGLDLSGVPVLDLDAEAAAIARRDPAPRPAPDLPGSLAYLIYTSGSTGRPKGVLVPHAALAAHAVEFARRLRLGPGDRVLQVASFAFDVSLDELVPTLLAGATFVAWRPEAIEPASLARALAERAATVVNLPTAVWHQAARAWAEGRLPVPPAALGALRWVLVGGEALPPRALEIWRRTPLGEVPLANGYGPTEAVVTATLHVPATGPGAPNDADLERLPIGRPFAGRVLLLLDRRGELAAPGAIGEIHLGGAPLARGYLGDPARTAEAFVPAPFGGEPGARLYRTGDLGRFRGDGSLEFLGRRDRQLKVRGFRVEPGEVEAALLAHPAVRQAAVVLAAGDAEGAGDDPEYRTLAAYVAPAPGAEPPSAQALRAFLGERLPAYMLPASFTILPELPTTPGAKVDRAALAARRPETRPLAPRGAAPEPAPTPASAVAVVGAGSREGTAAFEELVAAVWRELLAIEEVGLDDNFFDLGGHSMLIALVQARLQEALGADLAVLDLFNHPTVRGLAGHLAETLSGLPAAPLPPAEPAGETASREPLPRPTAAPASAAAAEGEAIAIVGMAGRFPGAGDVETFWENLREGVESISFFLPAGESWQPPHGSGTFQVPAGGVVEGAETWDAEFFGYGRREAELIDPQQRLFLECAWEALEDAGYGAAHDRGGRVGVFGGVTHSEYLTNLMARGLLSEPASSELATTGNERDYLAARVSYKLDLEGPSLTVAAACSTALVAVHYAGASLLAGECDLALAGGVAINSRQRAGYLYRPGSLVSPTARCRPFDAASDGTIDSDGVGVVALKRLGAALADGDTIHAVLRGSAVTNDGAKKVGFLAPRTAGRALAIATALSRASVRPEEIGFVEAHGNGTPLGDAIEVAALHQVFGAGAGPGSCALGSVKGNIGHTQSAAGAAGLIKAALALEHREIPPTLHFERASSEIDLAAGPFQVNTRLLPWEADGAPRRAGVSSFGHGGINAHVVLEEPPAAPPASPSRPWQLLLLSARSEAALAAATGRLAAHLARHPEQDLADVAFTLQVGRQSFAHRRTLLCRDRDEAAKALAALRSTAAPATAGLDPRHATTRTAPRRAPAVVFLLPGTGGAEGLGAELYAAEEAFRAAYDRLAAPLGLDPRTALAPGAAAGAAAFFAGELALAETLRGWGIEPELLVGAGVGELAAAVLAGTLDARDAAELVALWSRRPTPEAWETAVAALPLRPPAIPWISAATGRRVGADEAVDPRRWAERLTADPQLAAALGPLLADRFRLLLPIGPAETLVAAARKAAGDAGVAKVAAMLPPAEAGEIPAPAALLSMLGNLWLAGVDVDWKRYHAGETRRRVPLPTYPFERQRYWIDAPSGASAPRGGTATDTADAADTAGARDGLKPGS